MWSDTEVKQNENEDSVVSSLSETSPKLSEQTAALLSLQHSRFN